MLHRAARSLLLLSLLALPLAAEDELAIVGPIWTVSATSPARVAPAGDVDGDGYLDVIVGYFLDDTGGHDAGRVVVYRGTSDGIETSAPMWTLLGDQANARLGYSVSAAGDVDDDGYADILIGQDRYDTTQSDAGRVLLFLGSSMGPGASPASIFEGASASANLGASVATAGDVNGDGHADVIVGSPGWSSSQGRADVYLGSASGLAAAPVWTGTLPGFTATYGRSVATAGDVDGDGFDEVIVGAPFYSNGQSSEGAPPSTTARRRDPRRRRIGSPKATSSRSITARPWSVPATSMATATRTSRCRSPTTFRANGAVACSCITAALRGCRRHLPRCSWGKRSWSPSAAPCRPAT